MNQFIENVKTVLHLNSNENSETKQSGQQITECNYADNYYGDQHCQLKILDK
jgi:hypothetical protein